MLPANLAKTRTAGRGTYGELVVLSGGPSGSLGAVGQPTTVRYAPYPIPATITGHQQAAATTTHILPLSTNHGPSIIQYAPAVGATSNLYDAATAVSYKRLLAATAAASLRSHQAHRPTATLTYPLGDLLGVQGLDLPAGLYQIPTATIGL